MTETDDTTRIRIWEMGVIESRRRGLPPKRRWHWLCRECGQTDDDGYSSGINAAAGAQAHVDQRHGDALTADYEPAYDDPRPDNPIARPTVYTVTCLPEHVEDAHAWALTVECRVRGLWAVKRWSNCLGRDGEWDYERIPFEREDEWLAEHRFPLEEALELAKQAAPHVIVNGMTPADLLAWHAAGCPLPIPRPHSRARAAKSETETSTP